MELKHSRSRLTLVMVAFGALALLWAGRATYIQIIGDPRLDKLARRQFNGKVLVQPRRGLIHDRNGEPLAINIEVSSLAASPKVLFKNPISLRLLARGLGVHENSLRKRLNKKRSFQWIERQIPQERLDQWEDNGMLRADGSLPQGVWLIKEMRRAYPHGDLARPLIGTTNLDTSGTEGAEYWQNEHLRGRGVFLDAVKDALGRPAIIANNDRSQLKDGQSFKLSIDASLQFEVEEHLRDSMNTTGADAALAAVMDAETGQILALGQRTKQRVPKSKMITDSYEPGSTMKPILLAVALENGRKNTDGVHGGFGRLEIKGRVISEAEAHEKFGMMTLSKMVEVSSNVGAARLALELGALRTVTGYTRFGFGSRPGTGFPGEYGGKVPGTKLKPIELATLGFGHGLSVTPLQMLRAYSTFATGGELVEPRLDATLPASKKRIVSLKTAEIVAKALVGVTQGKDGTGKKARVPGYKIAGKTGTSQTVDRVTKRYSRHRYITSFIGFPVGASRKLITMAWVDYPKNNIYASETAAPLFAKVMSSSLKRFSVPTTEPYETEIIVAESIPTPTPTTDVEETSLKKSEVLAELETPADSIPNVVGLSASEAIQALKRYSPNIRVHGFGIVRKQSPRPGTIATRADRIELHLESHE
jgi:cell division protein FtsI (penicillin-binding protein 3)